MTLKELKIAFTKLRLYFKYSIYPSGIAQMLVQIDMLKKEPDTPKKFGLLAMCYQRLANSFAAKMSMEYLSSQEQDAKYSRFWVDAYTRLHQEYRLKWIKESLPLN